MRNLLKKSISEYQKIQDLTHNDKKILNEIRTKSKKAIALLRRDNFKDSEKEIKEAEKLFGAINKRTRQNKTLAKQGFYSEAVEEYVEAIVLHGFLTKNKIRISDYIDMGPEEAIAGISDFTGELVRKAITSAGAKNLRSLYFYKKEVEDVAEALTKIGLAGKLRKKYDEVERNLKKIEEIIYDVEMKK